MDVATNGKKPGDSGRMGLRRFLRSRLLGSRKRAVLAVVTACRLERHEEERYDGELAKEILELLNEAEMRSAMATSKLAGLASSLRAACRSSPPAKNGSRQSRSPCWERLKRFLAGGGRPSRSIESRAKGGAAENVPLRCVQNS